MPSVIQSTKVDPAVTASVAFTLSSTPTTGNLLIGIINYGQFGTTPTVTPPTGFTTYGTSTQTNDSIGVWWRIVPGGAGTTYTFTISEGSEFASGELIEISAADPATPINNPAAGAFTKSASTASLATASVTPSSVGCLALTAVVQDSNGAGTTNLASPTGWTEQQTASNASGRGGVLATKDALTTDTTTAISNTWSIGGGATECLSVMLLVQGAQPEPPGDPPASFYPKTLRPAIFRPGIAR